MTTLEEDDFGEPLNTGRRFDKYRLDGDTCRANWYAGDRMDWDNAMFAAFTAAGTSSA